MPAKTQKEKPKSTCKSSTGVPFNQAMAKDVKTILSKTDVLKQSMAEASTHNLSNSHTSVDVKSGGTSTTESSLLQQSGR